jgi:sugar diacid utilization regulator
VQADTPAPVLRRLDADVLAGADRDGAWLIVPDPDGPGRAAALRRATAGLPTALGPTVAPGDADRSLRWARLAVTLVGRGVIPSEYPTRVADHLAAVILHQDDELAGELIRTRLAPLERLPRNERRRMLETLSAWLAHQRQTPAIAAELHVHPQTVRYRVNRLRELLGDSLDTPDGRFELELALRARSG